MDWIYERVGRAAARLKPLVDRRVAHLAIQGSPEAQKLFYQFVAKVGTPLPGDPSVLAHQPTYNFLFPMPEAEALLAKSSAARIAGAEDSGPRCEGLVMLPLPSPALRRPDADLDDLFKIDTAFAPLVADERARLSDRLVQQHG